MSVRRDQWGTPRDFDGWQGKLAESLEGLGQLGIIALLVGIGLLIGAIADEDVGATQGWIGVVLIAVGPAVYYCGRLSVPRLAPEVTLPDPPAWLELRRERVEEARRALGRAETALDKAEGVLVDLEADLQERDSEAAALDERIKRNEVLAALTDAERQAVIGEAVGYWNESMHHSSRRDYALFGIQVVYGLILFVLGVWLGCAG